MTKDFKILIVDDEVEILKCLSTCIEKKGFAVETATDGERALGLTDERSFDLVITDLNLPQMSGLELLTKLKEKYPYISVILLAEHSTVELAVKAIKMGAYDFIEKPFEIKALLMLIDKLIDQKQYWEKTVTFEDNRRKTYRYENIIGNTSQMYNIFEEISSVAATDISVMIVGENGTGKELVANALHYKSLRKDKPFIKVNCGALAEGIIESELFGHEKGAFTGATSQRKGMFEMANSGTFFLDEIGELTPYTQVKLLRVLETWEFQRVGGNETLKSDFRFICATNKDLSHAAMNKEFREDLFYRINTAIIHLPPLRERKADIPLLIDYFLKRSCRKMKKNIRSISNEAMCLLMKHEWPGNVRELSHVIERGVAYCNGREIKPDNLPSTIGTGQVLNENELTLNLRSKTLADAEFNLILNILEESQWNLKEAAVTLGIARGTLYSKMKKYGIKKPF